MKPVRFAGSAREDLAAFPEAARGTAGYELFMVQVGREPSDFKPMPDVGPAFTRFVRATGLERFE
jgi:phage-related protein